MSKLLFIYNPNSGKGNIRKEISFILESFSVKGYEIRVFPTAKSGDAADMAKNEAYNYDLLVCAGGDGTFNEVARGLMEAKKNGKNVPAIGYIPVGTVNDFATSLDIPKEIAVAVYVILNGINKAVDIGSFETGDKDELYSYFTYVAAFGAFTEVAYETSQDVKNVIGKAAYFLQGVKSFPTIRPYNLKILYDGNEIEDDFIFGMIANSKSVGGFMGITGPEVYLDDGEFDAIFIKNPKTPMDLQNIINSFILMDLKTDNICHFHSGKIEIESDEKLQWTLDGEAGGSHKKVKINNHKKALTVKVKKHTVELV